VKIFPLRQIERVNKLYICYEEDFLLNEIFLSLKEKKIFTVSWMPVSRKEGTTHLYFKKKYLNPSPQEFLLWESCFISTCDNSK